MRRDPDEARRPGGRGFLGPGAWVFLGAFALLAAAGRSSLLRDPGTFWHTLVGERILQRGLPHADWLTFTFAGRPWVAHQWLAECAMAALHRLGGLDALLLAAAAALAGVLAFLYARLAARGVRPLPALLVVALAFLASSLHFHARPHVISIALFAAVYARLADVDLGRRRVASLAALWPVFLVWVNAHGAAVGGLATLGLFVAAWLAAWAAGRPSPIAGRADAARAAGILAACLATVALTPYGLGVARTWAAILGSRELPRVMVEHASLARSGSWQILALAAVHLAALLAVPRRAVTVAGVVPLAWLALTFDRVRHAPFFAVSAALALAELLPAVRRGGWPWRGLAGAAPAPPGRRAAGLAAGAAALALAAAAAWHQAAPRSGPALARLDPAYWPVELVPALREAERALGPGAAILNDTLLGGFVAYHAPGLKVLVDDRWELYGDAFYAEAVRADPAWLAAWAARGEARVALAQPGSRLERWLAGAPGWRPVAACRSGVLYRRQPPGT